MTFNPELDNKIAKRKRQQYEANLRYTLKKAEAGLCQYSARCSEPAHFMCPKHLAVKREQRKAWVKRTKVSA